MTYRHVATAGTFVPLTVGLLGLTAWTTGFLRLASVRTDFIPMAPSTAVACVLVSAALIALAFGHGTTIRNSVRAVACLVSILALIELVEFFAGVEVIDWETALIERPGMFGAVPLARMSPLASATFVMVGLALWCLTIARSPAVRSLGGVLGSLAVLMGSVVAVGYAYGAPLLYGGQVIPMALTTGLAFVGTGVALVALAGPTSLPLRPFAESARRADRADTGRRDAEAAVKQAEILARSLVEHLPQRIFIKDRNSRYVFSNANYARDLRTEPAQMVGKDDFAFYPPELAERYRSDDRKVIAEGKAQDIEEQYQLDGEVRWAHTFKVPYCDAQGRIIGVLGIFEDVTVRRQEDESRRLQSAALHAAADAIIITDRAGVVQWANPAFTVMTGYTAEETLGKNLRDLIKSGQHNQAFYKDLWDTILAGRTWHGAMINRRKDGHLYTEDQSVTPILDASGAITHFVAIKEDTVERLRLEAQFRQAERLEGVGQLAAGIAHDFNNLLTVINGMSELVLEQVRNDETMYADVQEIKRAGERAAVLTRHLLAFSRGQALAPRVVGLNSVVAGMESLLRRVIREDIKMAVLLTPGVDTVKVDSGQIEQVVTNLAVNARDAMPQGGNLTIETQNVTIHEDDVRQAGVAVPPGSYVSLTVTDSGIGMDEATRARIFEPFFTTKALGEGTGLGLATVYGIVTQSHGFTRVESEVGHGTRFQIYLPLVIQPAAMAQTEPTILSTEGTETVLLVEDNDELRKLTARMLEPAGYTVLAAASGEEALRLLEHREKSVHLVLGPVHLLLSDVVLSGMSGSHLADRIAQRFPKVRVLYMSGHTSDTVLQHGVLEDRAHFLAKPYTADVLVRKVRAVLDSQV